MSNDNDLQKEDFILPGGLGEIDGREIIKTVSDYRQGTLTITVAPPKDSKLKPVYGIVAELFLDRHPTEDADFEILQPKQIENENTKTS